MPEFPFHPTGSGQGVLVDNNFCDWNLKSKLKKIRKKRKSKKMEDKAAGRPSFPPPKKDRDVKTGVKKQFGNSRSKNGNPDAVIKYFNSCLHSN